LQAPEWSLELVVAIASAVAAIAAALFAWRSARTADRALEIAQIDHRERHAGLAAYLIDGIAWDDDEHDRLVAFACSVSNASSSPLSVVRVDLHLHVVTDEGTATRIVLSPQSAGAPAIWDLKALQAPLNLDTKATVSGWLGFKIPTRVSNTMTIDKYEIVFQGATGERTSCEMHLLQRIQNAARKD
jgi:hypothetical protein